MLAGQGLASPNGSGTDATQLPEPFQAAFRASALAGESPVAWVQTDLDGQTTIDQANVHVRCQTAAGRGKCTTYVQ